MFYHAVKKLRPASKITQLYQATFLYRVWHHKDQWCFSKELLSTGHLTAPVCVCICSIRVVVLMCTEFSSSDITHRYCFWWIIWIDTEKTILSYQCEMFIMLDKSLSHWAQSSKMIPIWIALCLFHDSVIYVFVILQYGLVLAHISYSLSHLWRRLLEI